MGKRIDAHIYKVSGIPKRSLLYCSHVRHTRHVVYVASPAYLDGFIVGIINLAALNSVERELKQQND